MEFCERRKRWLLWSFSLIYLISTGVLASKKPMWNDELYTFHMVRLPNLSDIWSALLTAGEQIPPLFYVITRMSLDLFGVSELTIRFPEIAGFWVMSLCLFRFVARRYSALYGFVAMLFPFVTKAYSYAYEARPYGLVLGFAGLALVCWQSAAEGHSRGLSLVALAVSLGAAVSSHYYAVLLLMPLAAGEAVRSISRRRLDVPVWVAFGSGMVPLFLFVDLIQQAKAQSAIFWARLHWGVTLHFYHWLLAPALLPLVVMLIVAAVYSLTHRTTASRRNPESYVTPPIHEVAAALGFLAIPLAGFVGAKVVTGVLIGRYVLPAVIGFGILIAFSTYRLLDGRAIIGASLVMLLCSEFAMVQIRNFQRIIDVSSAQAKAYEFLRSNNESQLPIVVSDLHTFMTIAHYAPQDIASRVVYLADPQASLRYLGHSSVDQGILDLKPWFGLKIEEYTSYVGSQQQFLVYGPIGWLNWLVSELIGNNRRIELKGRHSDNLLFLVSAMHRSNDGHSADARH